MLPEMKIQLFGTPSLFLDGQPVTGFISSKAPALVYFLAATAHVQTRDRIATSGRIPLSFTPKRICGPFCRIYAPCLVHF